MAISTATHPKLLWPGIHAFWGQQYNLNPEMYSQTHEVKSSKQAYEELKNIVAFPLAPRKTEGAAVIYSDELDGYLQRATHLAYALGYVVTHEELADNLYKQVSMARAGAIANSMNQTVETVAANDFNRAFNSTYTFSDGKELCATDHPNVSGGTWSNELTTAADLSEASLEDMCINIMNALDDRGLKINLNPKKLLVNPAEWFNSQRILKSVLQNDTANNAKNIIKDMISDVVVNRWFTDTDAWFIRTDAQQGLCFFWRERASFDQDNDFDTKNLKAKGYMRFSTTCGDPRSIYGTPGAA